MREQVHRPAHPWRIALLGARYRIALVGLHRYICWGMQLAGDQKSVESRPDSMGAGQSAQNAPTDRSLSGLLGQFEEDGLIVQIVKLGPIRPASENGRGLPRLAIFNGEPLLAHPRDTDGTLFLTYWTGKTLRLIS